MITIIVPVHNEKENLEELLPQLTDLPSEAPVEILVALSSETTDESENIAVGDKVKIFKCSSKGRAAQMNRAVEYSNGDILVFLHADVRPPKTFLLDIASTIAEGYGAGFFSYRFDKESAFLKINAFFTGKDGIFMGGGDQCLFIRKAIFEELNGFNRKQVIMEDFEFFERMKKKKVRYTIINNDLVVSARKYRYNSYGRVNLSNLILVVLFKLGFSASTLKSLHDRLIRSPYQHHS